MSSKKKNKKTTPEVSLLIASALTEDIGDGDITSLALIKKNLSINAEIVCKQGGIVICGLGIVREVFRQLDKRIKVLNFVRDGDIIKKPLSICRITGPAQAILNGERTALNFLGRLSGIATKTKNLADKCKPYKVKILDTRKTTPCWRMLEKYAVRMGGGYNHRLGLFDQVLIKDNHIMIMRGCLNRLTITKIIKQAKEKTHGKKVIEVEVKNIQELKQALKAGPDIIMLDNFGLSGIRKAVTIRNVFNPGIKLEASGNINEQNIVKIAKCGVDFISLGMLTHSVDNADFSLNVK